MTDFRTIRLGDVSLRAAIEGQGPLVVMVHFATEDHREGVKSFLVKRTPVFTGR